MVAAMLSSILAPGLFVYDTSVSILIPRIDRLSGRDNEGV